jgi:ABC-2 type transport system permease protein
VTALLLRIRTLIVKEFLIILRDPSGRAMLVVPPIIQLVLFAYAVTLEVSNVGVVVLNQDSGRHGTEVAARIEASPYFLASVERGGFQNIRISLENQKILMGVVIPRDFSSRLEKGTAAPIQVVSDGRRSNSAQIVTAYLTEIVAQYSLELAGRLEAGRLSARGQSLPGQNSSSLVHGVPPPPPTPPVSFSARHWFNPNLVYVWTIIPSLMAIITLLMTLNLSAMSLAREKEMGTFEQLLVTPLTPAEIIVGKLVPAMVVAAFESLLIYSLGRFFYGVPMRGSFPLLLGSIVLFSFSIIGFGLFISSIVKTQQQAIVGSFMFMVPCVALSGFAAPVENMPAWLQQAVVLNPLKHALVIMKGVFLKDMPAGEVWLNGWPLLVIGIAALLFSGWMFRKNLG